MHKQVELRNYPNFRIAGLQVLKNIILFQDSTPQNSPKKELRS